MREDFVINVCDAIMGSGKSSAAITYMNEHPDEKFIYVSPYLSETKRIKDSCPKLNFVEPNDGYKHIHTNILIKNGCNISISHNILRDIPFDILTDIEEQGYSLIIDESLDVFSEVDEVFEDVESLIQYSELTEKDNDLNCELPSNIKSLLYNSKKVSRPLSRYENFFKRLESNDIIKITSENGKSSYSWLLTLNFLTSFKHVFILTYLFEGSLMCTNLQLSEIPYKKIGVNRTSEGYRFGEYNEYIPEYVKTIKNKIHIVNEDRLNDIGNDRNAFSMNWIETRKEDDTKTIVNNLSYYFRYFAPCPQSDRMWGSFAGKKNNERDKGELRKKLSGGRYTKSFVIFNKRATNELRNKRVLAYTANVFMNTGQKQTLAKRGIVPMEQTYALSTLVQWVWRSAIRDGQEITLYIPSYRMRTLFIRWLDIISTNGDVSQIEEPIPRLFGYK